MIAPGVYVRLAASAISGIIFGLLLKKRTPIPELGSSTERHNAKVRHILHQLTTRKHHGPLRLRKKAVSHHVPTARQPWAKRLDVSALDEIISIDPVSETCVAEAGVTFVDLVKATLKYGLVPIIVPDFMTITIGGAVAGGSVESMSFKYGGFHDTCLEYEVITPKGDVLICTPDNENHQLFQMIHGTFGTLGIISKVKFKLVPAKRFVRVTYEKYRTLEEFNAAIWKYYKNHGADYIDGFIHSPKDFVLCVGHFVDEAPYLNSYDWMKVYFHSTRERQEDYMQTLDYFYRYDRGITNVHPKSAIGRFLFGKFLGSAQLLWLAEKFPWFVKSDKPDVIVDMFVPYSKSRDFLDWHQEEFNFFPLWCVPYKRVRDYPWLSPAYMGKVEDELFLDLAIFGMPQPGEKNAYRQLEEKLHELGGIKTLISHNFYTHDEFWTIWNKPLYEELKARLDPHNILQDLHTKTCKPHHR